MGSLKPTPGMPPLAHWVAQTIGTQLLQAKEPEIPKRTGTGVTTILRRGREIDGLLAEGLSLKQAADKLGVTQGYVSGLYGVYRRLPSKDRGH